MHRATRTACSRQRQCVPTVLPTLRARKLCTRHGSLGLRSSSLVWCLLLNTNHASRTTCARAGRLNDHSGDCPKRDFPARSS